MALFTFREKERLKKKKLIDQLFTSGMSFFSYPFKVVWLLTESDHPYPVRVLISVSRRTMKRAVDRNRVKRQVREVYRHQKDKIYAFLEEKKQHALLGIIFTGNELLTHEQTSEKINQVMARLLKEMKKQIDH